LEQLKSLASETEYGGKEAIAMLVVAWYTRALPDDQIVWRAQAIVDMKKNNYIDGHTVGRTLRDLLKRLGVKAE
jgi:hypothetical protein